jgi:drug/metabolite transporter (DMT)-like permease
MLNYGLFLIKISIGIILLFPFYILESSHGVEINWSFQTIVGILYLGVFASVISFLCWNYAVAQFGPSKASPYLNLIPVFATFFAVTFLNESLTLPQIIGGVLVIIGVLITSWIGFEKTKLQKKRVENEG